MSDCTPFFKNLCLAVEHCWVFCIGSCQPAHEDRTKIVRHVVSLYQGGITENKAMIRRYNACLHANAWVVVVFATVILILVLALMW